MFNRTTGLMGALLIVVGAVVTEVDEREALGEAFFTDTNLSLREHHGKAKRRSS